MKKLVLAIVGAALLGCASNPSQNLIGKWSMLQVIQNGEDVTADHNPHLERYLIFNADSTFKSGGRPFGENTGAFSMNTQQQLFLDSDAGSEDDSYWNVRISNDTMYWQGYGSEWAENFQIIQVREKE